MHEPSVETPRNEPDPKGRDVALGAGAGMILGSAFGSAGVGLVLGAALGLVFTFAPRRSAE